MSIVTTTQPSYSPSVRSLPDTLNEFAGMLLYEEGFGNIDTDKTELMEVLRALEDSREEGRSLYPEILLTSRLDECLKPIYPKQMIICGETTERSGRIKRAIKRCAPLAVPPWIIVLDVGKHLLRYGLVSSTIAAETAPLSERIFDVSQGDSTLPLIYLRRHGARAVFVRTPKQQTIVSLTLSEELLVGQTHIDQFSNIIVGDVDENRRSGSARVVTNLLTQAFREGHGLFACVISPSDIENVRLAFPDGAYLTPPLSLSTTERDEHSGAAALEVDSALRARVVLGQQMVETDLMTIFSTDGCLLGYNVHIPNSGGTLGSVGGARTRAYKALCEAENVRAALICSQDGQTQLLSKNAH